MRSENNGPKCPESRDREHSHPTNLAGAQIFSLSTVAPMPCPVPHSSEDWQVPSFIFMSVPGPPALRRGRFFQCPHVVLIVLADNPDCLSQRLSFRRE